MAKPPMLETNQWSKIIINQLLAPLDNNNMTVHLIGIQKSYLCIITCQKTYFQLFSHCFSKKSRTFS